jgi:heat shock protein HtpX
MRRALVLRLDAAALARQRAVNRLHAMMLFLGLASLAGITGFIVAGPDGLLLGAAMVLLFLLLDPVVPGDVLFRQAFGAVRLVPGQAPGLFDMLEDLARRADLRARPAVYLIPSRVLQAMAAGTTSAPSIALTLGLLQALPPRELAAVLAHELAHIRHCDVFAVRIAAAAASLTRMMAMLGLALLTLWLPAYWSLGQVPPVAAILLLVAAPVASDLLTLSLSRRREFLADAGAVELTGDPAALASALARIHRLQGDDWERMMARGLGWLRWLRTHPGAEARIRRLAAMVAPVQVGLPAWARMDSLPGALCDVGGHHPTQRMVRRWLL